MASGKDELTLIMARLSGNISQEEEYQLSTWIGQSDFNLRMYEEAVRIWESSHVKLVHPDPATEQEWERLKSRLLDKRTLMPSLETRVGLGIAASIIILVLFAIYFFDSSLPRLSIIAVDEVKTIYLPDSSKVWLNINSEISYSEDFGKPDRTVTLKGEAYFMIKPDTVHPFTVLTENTSIVVMGTVFNASISDSVVNVIVEEGKVNLRDDMTGQSLTLTQGEKGVRSGSSLIETKNTDPLFSSWRKRNNPIYSEEVNNPLHFLRQKYSGEKNQINQSVITGFISSTATLASFGNITLKVTYKKPNGKLVITRFYLNDQINPGKTLEYRKRLLDIFTKKPVITVEIEKVEIVK